MPREIIVKRTDYPEAMDLSGSNPDMLFNIWSGGEHAKAMKTYQLALEMNPNTSEALGNLEQLRVR